MLEKFIIILLFSFQKISPIWIFDSDRSYRNNRYNWADCRLRGSSFISRFLEAEEQINAPTSMREVGRFALETIAVIKDAPDCDLRFRSASKKFVGQSQKCEPVCLLRNNIPRYYYRYTSVASYMVTPPPPFIWANQTVFVD